MVLPEPVDDDADDAVEVVAVVLAVVEALADEQDVRHMVATVGVAAHEREIDALVPRLHDPRRRRVADRGATVRRLERRGDPRVPAAVPDSRPIADTSTVALSLAHVTRGPHAATVSPIAVMSVTTPSSNSANRVKRGGA